MNMTPEFVGQCIAEAMAEHSKCTTEILAIEGMSSAKVRHFLNNVCSHPDAKYLEVGVWKGATFCSALCGNSISALAVDNFSEFGGTHEQFVANCESTIGRIPKCCSMDFRQLGRGVTERFNILFYDAGHSYEDQRAAIIELSRVLEMDFLLVVDDWNWTKVRSGTMNGIRDAGISITASWELPANDNGDIENWWNGLFVALCQRPASFSIIIPSIGRESLAWTLESVTEQTCTRDEVIVVFDGRDEVVRPLVDVVRNMRGIHALVLPGGPKNDYGAEARTVGARLATGDFLAFIDDDDVYLPGALATVRRAISDELSRPHMFRMTRQPHAGELWNSPVISLGNVSTQMFVTPNDPGRLGQWTSRYGGDYDFIRSTVDLYPTRDRSVVWHEEVVAHWNAGRGSTGRPSSSRGVSHDAALDYRVDTYPNNYQILSEINELALEVRGRNPRTMLEIGSLEGYTLSRWCESLTPGATIVSIDLLVPDSDARFPVQLSGHRGAWGVTASKCGHAFCMLSGNSRDSRLASLAAANAPFQFIFVDGDHSYEGVRSDWLTYFPMLADRAIIAFHDIGVNEPHSGVNRLWNEIKADFRYREILHCPFGTKGIGIIYKRE
jgi:predicted O-methyltransferase YrrM